MMNKKSPNLLSRLGLNSNHHNEKLSSATCIDHLPSKVLRHGTGRSPGSSGLYLVFPFHLWQNSDC
jgi:hypothetical protein